MVKKFKNGQKKFIIFGLLIIALFFVVRLVNLTILPIFADEAIYIRWSQVMRAEPTLRFLPLSDGKQPLFMWLTIPFLKIFSDPLLAGRFLSVLAGLGSLVGITLIAWLLFKEKRIVLMTALFYAVVPFFVFFDRLALVDSLLAMFSLWLCGLSLLLIRYQRWDLAMVTGMILGGALLTKSPAIFFALFLPAALLSSFAPLSGASEGFRSTKEEKIPRMSIRGASFLPFKKKNNFLKILALWMIVWLFGFGLYNFLLRLGPGFQMIAIRNKDYLFSLKEILSHPLDPLKPHFGDLRQWLPNLLTWPIFWASIGGILVGLRKKLKITLFLLIWFVIPLLAQAVFAKVFTPRYILFTVWPLLLFAAFFLDWLCVKMKRKSWIIIILFLIFLIPAFNYDWLLLFNPERAPLPRNLRNGHLEEWTAGQGLKESAVFFKERARDGSVFVGTEGFFGTLPDGLQIYLEGVANIRVIGVGWPVVGVHPSLVNSLVDNEVYLLVNQSRLNLLPQNNGLMLVREYPKAAWPDGHRDKLLLFQLDKNYWQSKRQ